MKIFPSKHEEKLALVVISYVMGLLLGIFLGANLDTTKDLLPAFTTLFAAFFGTWFAYKLQREARKREELKNNVANANRVLFVLYKRLNCLKIFQLDFINPGRDDPGRFLNMQPVLDFESPKDRFEPSMLDFLLGTKCQQLIFDLDVEEQRFIEAVKCIRFRSNLHLNQYQPALFAAGVKEGVDYSDKEIKNVIGDLLYTYLQKSTKDMIYHVDRTLESSNDIRVRLIRALNDIYPKNQLLEFELLEDQIGNRPSNDFREDKNNL